MRLLVITNNLHRASFRQRVEAYLELLNQPGIETAVESFPKGPLGRMRLLKSSADFDGVLLHKKRLNPTDAFLLRRYARKIIYDFDDAVMYSDKHPEKEGGKRQWDFERTVRLADLVIAGNEYLAAHARKITSNVKILPTGLDTEAYNVDVEQPGDGKVRLVWIGSTSTLGYLRDLSPVLEEIGRTHDNVILRIICDRFFDLKNIKVEKRQWSLDAEVQDLRTCDIGLAPLADNNFTRGKCGFKILQCFAAGLPVVASPVGVNVDLVREGVNGFAACDDNTWIGRLLELMNGPAMRKQMGGAARQSVASYDVRTLGEQLRHLIGDCLCGGAL